MGFKKGNKYGNRFQKGNQYSKMRKSFKISEETKNKISIGNKGKQSNEKHFKWKGDHVGKRGLHLWIVRHKPKSMFCEKCGKITDRLDASNISGFYKRDISDFRWLCRSCHKKVDYKKESMKNAWDSIKKNGKSK